MKQGENNSVSRYSQQYDGFGRFASYWHQIEQVSRYNPDSLVEVGVGNRFVSRYLSHHGFELTTIDHDSALRPDIAGEVSRLPLKDSSFQMAVCCEVLEHIPFAYFVPALKEFHRVTRDRLVISVPDVRKTLRFSFNIPFHGLVKYCLSLPTWPTRHEFDGEHHWEIGKSGYPLARVKEAFHTAGFQLLEHFRVFEHCYHHFFILGND